MKHSTTYLLQFDEEALILKSTDSFTWKMKIMIENLSLKKNTIIFRDVYFRTTTLIVIVWVRISTKFPSIVPTDPEPWIIKETDLKP